MKGEEGPGGLKVQPTARPEVRPKGRATNGAAERVSGRRCDQRGDRLTVWEVTEVTCDQRGERPKARPRGRAAERAARRPTNGATEVETEGAIEDDL